MLYCCICDVLLETGDYIIEVKSLVLARSTLSGKPFFAPSPMEDGSYHKFAHSSCPGAYGAPLSLVGADTRSDV